MAANLPVASEHAEQAALFRWAAVMGAFAPWLELLFAIPNGMAASSLERGQKDEARGPAVGSGRYLPAVPRGRYHGLFLEMKRLEWRAVGSYGQPALVDRAADRSGYLATWAPGWEKASQIILNYLDRGDA